jgi:signal transduction histidine kinase
MWSEDITAHIFALAPARLVLLPALGGAGAALTGALRDSRRRATLNEHLHEVRRPLQVLALMAPPREGPGEGGEGPVEMAAAALARLEREVNGERGPGARGLGGLRAWAIGADAGAAGLRSGRQATVAVRPLLESARRRWAMRAALTGAAVTIRWDADEAAVAGDRIDLAAALDNLIANALEHGGSRIELAADLVDGRLCLAVVDSGPGAGRRAREREARRRGKARAPFRGLSGRARHGHGLRVVRRVASRHGGAFALHLGERGTSAVLELPLAGRPGRSKVPWRDVAPERPLPRRDSSGWRPPSRRDGSGPWPTGQAGAS